MRKQAMVLAGVAASVLALTAVYVYSGGGACATACKTDACLTGAEGKEGAIKAETAEPSLNTAGLKALLDSGTRLALLDARTGQWDDGRRIPGAIALSADSTDEEIARALPDKNALIVTYCGGVKCPASRRLAHRLGALGYKNLVEYPEGIAGWVEAGHAVETGK